MQLLPKLCSFCFGLSVPPGEVSLRPRYRTAEARKREADSGNDGDDAPSSTLSSGVEVLHSLESHRLRECMHSCVCRETDGKMERCQPRARGEDEVEWSRMLARKQCDPFTTASAVGRRGGCRLHQAVRKAAALLPTRQVKKR